jgi:hypothetical protein
MYSWVLYYFRGAKKIIIEIFPLKYFVKENEASIGNILCAKPYFSKLINYLADTCWTYYLHSVYSVVFIVYGWGKGK